MFTPIMLALTLCGALGPELQHAQDSADAPVLQRPGGQRVALEPPPEPEPEPEPAAAEAAAPAVQRPTQPPAWTAFNERRPAAAPTSEWTPLDEPSGLPILPPSLRERFEPSPAPVEVPGDAAAQVWEDEPAPIVRDRMLGRR